MSAPPLASGCGICGKKENLQRCEACRVMMYCSEDHQADHRPLHESACNMIEKRWIVVEQEEEALWERPEDFMIMPVDLFTNEAESSWPLAETRQFMTARLGLALTMTQIVTVESVKAQLNQLLDMLILCRRDTMGVRILVPSLMLRLDKDYECYGFLEWWALADESEDFSYYWKDYDLPYLDMKDANVFEPVGDISHNLHVRAFPLLVCLVLLKIKLLVDLVRLEQVELSLETKVPREIIDMILPFVPQSPAIGAKYIRNGQTRAAEIANLQAQLEDLFRLVSFSNQYFWETLINHSDISTVKPEPCPRGSLEEAKVALNVSYHAWDEIPGAIDFVKEKLGGKT